MAKYNIDSNPIYFDSEQETMPVEELKNFQLNKLKDTVAYVLAKSDFYKNRIGLKEETTSFDNFTEFSNKIPFTTKKDLINAELYENLCVPKEDVEEIHFSSGTSNKPVHSFLSKKDLELSSKFLARTWYMQGLRKESTVAMFPSYGLFSAGLINHYAIQQIGSFIIPIGNATSLKAFQLLKDFKAHASVAVASYYLYLAHAAETDNVNIFEFNIKHMIAGGEPFSEKQRAYIEQKFGAQLFDQYGLCEINTGLAGECVEKNGLHILADYVYPEIIDPESEKVMAEGEEGELVLTTFYKEASPLIRYRTGDITSLSYDVCPCGRTMPRISHIKGRVTDTIFYKGINIEKPYVAGLFEDLSKDVNPYIWQMEAISHRGRDELVFKIIRSKESKKDLTDVAAYLQKKIGVKSKVFAFTDEELKQHSIGKIKHFVDNRT
jgi:phenylacetate-CoA ligase